jgi:hypothetical protein
MEISLRKYLLWIVKYAKRTLNHVVYTNIAEMTENKITGETIDYVYCTSFTDNEMISVVSDKARKYYVIRTKRGGARSLQQYSGLFELVRSLKRGELDELQLKPLLKTDLTEFTDSELNSVDFIGLDRQLSNKLWNVLVSTGRTIKLTGLHKISQEDLTIVGDQPSCVEQLLLNQMIGIKDYSWVKFPNLRTLSIRNNPYLTYAHLETICVCPNLKELEIHSCPEIDGRIFCLLGEKFPNLESLILNLPTAKFQKGEEGNDKFKVNIIDDSQWAQMKETPLKRLLIDSVYLTTDFVAPLLDKFTLLQRIFVKDSLVPHFYNGTQDGYDERIVFFHSITDESNGFSRRRDVKFTNLLSDRYNREPYSNFMLKKINQMKTVS